MAFLKIMFLLMAIVIAIVLLVVLFVLIALSIKIQVGFEYTEDSKRFWLKYGLIPLKIYPEMFSEKSKAKRAKLFGTVKRIFGPKASNLVDKAKDVASKKAEESKEKKSAEKDLNDAVFFEEEEKRIAAEEARLEVELPQAEADYEAAAFAEKEGRPFPEVVKEEEVSKLEDIKLSIQAMDIPGAVDKIKAFMSGFSFDSIVALISCMGKSVSGALGKVLRKIIIKHLNVGLTISGDDAAKTAIKYGSIAAVAYPSLGKMTGHMTVRDISLDMTPDYLANKDSGEIYFLMAFRPLMLVTPFVGMVPRMMKGVIVFFNDYRKTKKAKAKANAQA